VGLALVTRIPSLVEAQIAVGALRSGGIEAQVFDANFGAMESPVIESLGGFRIMVPESQVASAKELLALLRASPGLGEPDENGPWTASLAQSSRHRTRGLRMVAGIVVTLVAAIFLLRLIYH
jgi:hypothetical protein